MDGPRLRKRSDIFWSEIFVNYFYWIFFRSSFHYDVYDGDFNYSSFHDNDRHIFWNSRKTRIDSRCQHVIRNLYWYVMVSRFETGVKPRINIRKQCYRNDTVHNEVDNQICSGLILIFISLLCVAFLLIKMNLTIVNAFALMINQTTRRHDESTIHPHSPIFFTEVAMNKVGEKMRNRYFYPWYFQVDFDEKDSGRHSFNSREEKPFTQIEIYV